MIRSGGRRHSSAGRRPRQADGICARCIGPTSRLLLGRNRGPLTGAEQAFHGPLDLRVSRAPASYSRALYAEDAIGTRDALGRCIRTPRRWDAREHHRSTPRRDRVLVAVRASEIVRFRTRGPDPLLAVQMRLPQCRRLPRNAVRSRTTALGRLGRRTSARPSSWWRAPIRSIHPRRSLTGSGHRGTGSVSPGVNLVEPPRRRARTAAPLHMRDRRPGNASPRGGELGHGTLHGARTQVAGTDVFPTRRPAKTAGAPRAAWISERRGRVRARGGH